jgi:spoIIIJ-associated protein
MSATEITAHDVETAIKIGLAQLNLLRAEVKIEVLDEGSKGVLGIGARQARVRLTPFAELPTTPAPAEPVSAPPTPEPAAPVAPAPSAPVSEIPAVQAEAPAPAPEAPTATEEAPAQEPEPEAAQGKSNLTEETIQLAAELTQGVLDRMDLSANCTIRLIEPRDADDNPSIWVDIQGRDASRLLAHQSEALEALQLVVQTMWAHQTKSNLRLTIDADSYKERRTQHLQQMAQRLAERVVSSGRSITLEPMSAAERRLVHIALRDHPSVITESHGEGSARRLTIRLKQ